MQAFKDEFQERVTAMRMYYAEPPVRGQEDAHGHAMVPTKTLADGTVVPAFKDAPLRVRPPDYDLLTDGERLQEHQLRLNLYRDITERIENAMRLLEDRARAHRRSKGYGPSDDKQG